MLLEALVDNVEELMALSYMSHSAKSCQAQEFHSTASHLGFNLFWRVQGRRVDEKNEASQVLSR